LVITRIRALIIADRDNDGVAASTHDLLDDPSAQIVTIQFLAIHAFGDEGFAELPRTDRRRRFPRTRLRSRRARPSRFDGLRGSASTAPGQEQHQRAPKSDAV